MQSRIARASMYGLGLAVMISAMGGHLHAALAAVPEIDGSSISAGLAGLTAAVLILRSRRRSK
jgi:hypothetical protein